jgi:hypothetical protein
MTNNSKPDPDDYGPEPADYRLEPVNYEPESEPAFTRFNSVMRVIARFVGALAAVILIAGTAGYVWGRWV